MTVADVVARELLKNPELEQFSKMVEKFGTGMKALTDSPEVRGLAARLAEFQMALHAFSDSPAGREFFAGLKNFVDNGLPVAPPPGAYVALGKDLPVLPLPDDVAEPNIKAAPRRRIGFAAWDS